MSVSSKSGTSRRRTTKASYRRAALVVVGVVAAGSLMGGSVQAAGPAAGGAPNATVPSLLAQMTLEEKVGQLFVTQAHGETVDTTKPADVEMNRKTHGVDNAEQLIDKYKLGGVIYFAWSNNVNNPRQIAGLSNGIQRAASEQPAKVPMLISTDQEYGIVTRVGPPATQFPGSMALGAGRSAKNAYKAAKIGGQELGAIGVSQNFAPIADVNVNPQNPVIGVRSFGEDPQLVAKMVAAQVEGYERSIASTTKHFPGHGDTDVDSHTGIPVINHTREEWEKIDLPPFKAAIAEGVDAIMTAHIVVPSLDPSGDPATLSKPIMTGILRNELGYDGVLITDALTMAGVRAKYGDARVPVLALKAGVDQLLMPPDLDLAYNAVLNAVRGGELTEQRIDESVTRVLRLKLERGLFEDSTVDVDRVSEVVGSAEHLAAAQKITDRTVTLIKNDDGVLPLAVDSGRKLLVTGWGATTTATLAGRLTQRGVPADALATGAKPTDAAIDAAIAAANERDLTVVLTNKSAVDPQQQKLVDKLLATGKPVVMAAVRDPYDIAWSTRASTYLATYSATAPSMESLARVLFGEVDPTGTLPVTLPAADDPGRALFGYGHGLGYDDGSEATG